jgi:hypothetical protein
MALNLVFVIGFYDVVAETAQPGFEVDCIHVIRDQRFH